MTRPTREIIIISASSDIGAAMGERWLDRGWNVYGTYRTDSPAVAELRERGAKLVNCDVQDVRSIREASSSLREQCPRWDILVLCPSTLTPVGHFLECDFDEWESSFKLNFTSQMRFVHELLPSRRTGGPQQPCVLFFAGGGTNSAPVSYSAYTVSKIALIKMCELLDAEVEDSRFAILGPGWVRTKIHDATIAAGDQGGDNYRRTVERLDSNDFTPMDRVLDCCDWLIDEPRDVVSGRNFSLEFDLWGSNELAESLRSHPGMYKLRRDGNNDLKSRSS